MKNFTLELNKDNSKNEMKLLFPAPFEPINTFSRFKGSDKSLMDL